MAVLESEFLLISVRKARYQLWLGLAEAAEMSNGTVYNYFSTKEEVLDAVAIELASRFSGTVRVLGESTSCGAERVSLGTRLYIQRAKEDPQWAKALVRLVNFHMGLNSAVASFIASDIRAGVEEGHFELADEALALLDEVPVEEALADAEEAEETATEGQPVDPAATRESAVSP